MKSIIILLLTLISINTIKSQINNDSLIYITFNIYVDNQPINTDDCYFEIISKKMDTHLKTNICSNLECRLYSDKDYEFKFKYKDSNLVTMNIDPNKTGKKHLKYNIMLYNKRE